MHVFPRRILFTAILVITFALPAAAADRLIQLSNDELELDIDLSLKDGHVRLRDRKSGEAFTAVDFGVIRAYDITEDRMRTLIISPDVQTSYCKIDIEKTSNSRAVVHIDTGSGSPSAMGTMSFGIKFDVHLALKGRSFEYTVPIASLEEMDAQWNAVKASED